MTVKMMAAQLYGVGDLRVEEVGRLSISSDDEVLIRIHACGICPSDLRAYTGVREPYGSLPYTPGHEWAGEIVAIGDGVEEFALGDRVVPSWRVVCGKCHYCVRGFWNYCENLQYGRVRGGFGEYGVAPVDSLLKIPEGVSYQEASFCEPLACCINGSLYTGIGFGSNVVVIGAGPIGLMHMQLAKRAGARVIVSELISERLEKAQELGADALVYADREDPVERVKELTDGYGADAVIVAVGARRALVQALEMAGIGGAVNFFAGVYPPLTLDLDPNLIHYKQIRLTGSHDFTPYHFRTALRFIEMQAVRVPPLISHEFRLEQVKTGFDIVAGQKGLKVMITMGPVASS